MNTFNLNIFDQNRLYLHISLIVKQLQSVLSHPASFIYLGNLSTGRVVVITQVLHICICPSAVRLPRGLQ